MFTLQLEDTLTNYAVDSNFIIYKIKIIGYSIIIIVLLHAYLLFLNVPNSLT